jgi:NADH:ubiquinone oxidoreductase subunit F (NADH-binding)
MDSSILEGDPHTVLEAMAIAVIVLVLIKDLFISEQNTLLLLNV